MPRTFRMPCTFRRTAAAAAVAAVAVSVLAGCQSLPSSSSGGQDPTNVSIMVGGLDKVIYLPAELTDRLGYF
ncbi:MAG: sulfonate transport system substrate-binding protein, partial [Pseudonocardia sp.]